MEVLIYRNDEDEMEGTLFLTLREAIDHMKQRATKEKRELSEYIIKPIDVNQ